MIRRSTKRRIPPLTPDFKKKLKVFEAPSEMSVTSVSSQENLKVITLENDDSTEPVDVTSEKVKPQQQNPNHVMVSIKKTCLHLHLQLKVTSLTLPRLLRFSIASLSILLMVRTT